MTAREYAQIQPSAPRSCSGQGTGLVQRRQWEGCLPDVYQQIRDPGAFFAALGEVIAHSFDEIIDHLAGDDQHGEDDLARVARLTAAREQATYSR